MVLADTSIWIAHFREGNPILSGLLSEGLIAVHPFVSGELACGNLKSRKTVLSYLARLPAAQVAGDFEVMQLLDERRLWGRGLGWVDAHLLAAALISHCRFWTLDRKLGSAAAELGIS